ncbi:formyltransferase family protein [Oceaniferula spumae]|uniref:formyltransferase family protein n=1 Tax=Oceaniferula spumae TaxID=2979115 RepID=UPI003F4F004D
MGSSSADVSVVIWQKQSAHARSLIEAAWREEAGWDIAFSVYSDYVLPSRGLDRIRVPLNIHPALPSHPGVGYDVLPLIDGEKKCGATMHWMDEQIDHGVVLESSSMEIPQNANYPVVRKLNQMAVLSLFEKWFRLATGTTQSAFFERLRVPVSQGRGWTGPYVSEAVRTAKLNDFQRMDPVKWEKYEIPPALMSPPRKVSRA